MKMNKHLPSKMNIAGRNVLVSYDGQPITCYGCGHTGHMYWLATHDAEEKRSRLTRPPVLGHKLQPTDHTYVTSHEMCATTEICEACWYVSRPELHVRSRDVSRVDRNVSLPQNSMLNTSTALVTSHELM
jgi:hypothetical protein